ncbi:MAG: AAA family ATPase, partial [Sulfolobus sp.]|nr:AAA family ATPase [Sulfolobus sp.]
PAVIFLDEIDSIAPMRGFAHDSGVTERIVNQLLAEMDGIEKLENVVVIAATNRPDILDPALLRPGRFEKLIYVPPPDEKARVEILKVHTRNIILGEDVSLDELAKMTEGYTGADLAALVRDASMRAVRENMKICIDEVSKNAKSAEERDKYMKQCMKERIVKVRFDHFQESLRRIKPSITQDMIQFYQSWIEKARQQIPKQQLKPSTFA